MRDKNKNFLKLITITFRKRSQIYTFVNKKESYESPYPFSIVCSSPDIIVIM